MKKTFSLLLLLSMTVCAFCAQKKTVYVSYILHGNMNYDRYVRPTIWKEFPVIYDNLLDFMDEHQDFAGQLQFSGQTIGSLMQCAPEVVEHARRIHARGQLNFTGTFYSEPVNVNMDGETNFRCCWLGTRIVEDIVGETDGFYLQERAYHPQLPWIFNHSSVSWTPVITGQDDWGPFRLLGMDGSESVCVPITRSNLIEKIVAAPKNSLLTIEEDYEIPQSFADTYAKISEFNRSNSDNIVVKWITVKDYIRKFGIKEGRYVDHAAKAGNRDNGTYSRWTADPLDIIVQNHTNIAMADIRSAEILDALVRDKSGVSVDVPYEGSGISLIHDPLVWNIERAELYPGIEDRYLARDGKVTLLSKAENLLLWAVNSDAKGWYPLYEKRRERINSFMNSSMLSRAVINGGMDYLGEKVSVNGEYESCYMIMNLENERTKTVTIKSDRPMSVYDCSDGTQLASESLFSEGVYENTFSISLPSYGYRTVGLRGRSSETGNVWKAGEAVSCGGLSVSFENGEVVINDNGKKTGLSMDDFQIKALAEMTDGKGDSEWRDAVEYGRARVSIKEGVRPQLRVERQIDWLVHMKQVFTIVDGKVLCDIDFVFPHPTLVRKVGKITENTFDPRGLSLKVSTNEKASVNYDIPFGISGSNAEGISYLCPLSTCFLQHKDGGVVVSPQTGEQAFSCDAAKGELTLFLGASTTSGPIRDVGLTFNGKTDVEHESAWYSEPFHGEYSHRVVIFTYGGDWKDSHVPERIRAVSSPIYIREIHTVKNGVYAPMQSFAVLDRENVDVCGAVIENGKPVLRLNEREGCRTEVTMSVNGRNIRTEMSPFGIMSMKL